MQLHELGWTETLTRQFQTYDAESLSPARVIREDRGRCVLATEVGEIAARVSGRFRHDARERIDLPAVGDWVAFRPRPEAGRGTIHAVLPRQSRFVRKVAGETAEAQVVAANVDVVFLVTGLDANYRLRRIERYLALAAESGARPVILLSKCDLQAEPDRFVMEVEAVAAGVPIHAVSARCGTGVERALAYLGAGETGALLGSSGVGKSSLVNRWLGEDRLRTAEVRASDGRGRHATTRRELFRLPGGQLVIDTPGLRELRLWGDRESLAGAFGDIEELAAGCRFRDCRHEGEPGCAVQRSLGDGGLDVGRFESYLEQGRELDYLRRRCDVRARKAEEGRWRRIAIESRRLKKRRDRGR
jgi:ribosome biogenesis GTPase